jgi:uncharacterized protein involved in response to NO
VLYVLKGGVLAPIFTGNALREKGRGDQAPFNMPLEIAATGAVLLLAACDLGAAPRPGPAAARWPAPCSTPGAVRAGRAGAWPTCRWCW